MSAPGFAIRDLATVDAIAAASRLFDEVWPGERTTMPSNILRALAHAGNYVVGVYDGERMVGASAAFFGPPASRTMHSHITGILPGHRSQGLGRMLKHHQRDWALERGVGHITWTFDPLIARNAHFNLRSLGAHATDYLVDHYGPMNDDVNRGEATDRLLVDWAIAAGPAEPPADGAVRAAVAIPHDIEALRRTDPDAAGAWRRDVRTALLTHLAAGLVIGGFDDERGYLLVQA